MQCIDACIPAFQAETLWPELMAIACFLILPWIGIIEALQQEYSHAYVEAERSTATLAQALEESTRRTVGLIDYILLSARAQQAALDDRSYFHDWVRAQTLPDKMTAQIAATDASGMVTASTIAFPSGINVADRQHFRAQLDPAHDDLYISQPVIGRVSGIETIQFSRKRLAHDGTFAGIVVVSLGSDELTQFYNALGLEKGFVAIVSGDGTILARGPRVNGIVRAHISPAAIDAGMTDRASGSLELPATALRGNHIASFRRLQDYPLIVVVGKDMNSVFEQYRALRTDAVLSGLTITVAVLLIGFFWLRQKHRSLASRRALMVTLDTISQGILMVDARGGVSVINPRVADLLGHDNENPEDVLGIHCLAGVCAGCQPNRGHPDGRRPAASD